MLKRALLYSIFIFSLGSCTSFKTAFTGKKTPETTRPAVVEEKKETKFLDQIFIPARSDDAGEKDVWKPLQQKEPEQVKPEIISESTAAKTPEIEKASALQLKYSVLLNTNVEEVTNMRMFEFIDEWYGTRYRLGGTTKKGIDCSAFSQYLFAAVYNINLPRTAREQYRITSRISRTELKEGDLLFFNTRGGVSHVGVYLQNNRFVHASTSGGVMISDIFENYWVRRFIGVGRLKNQEVVVSGQ